MIGVRAKASVEKDEDEQRNPAGSAIPRTRQRSPHFRQSEIKSDPRRPTEIRRANITNPLSSFIVVVENVMAHLVAHDETNFRQGGLLEKIVVERDAGGAEKTGHVCAWLLRLARRIELVNFGDRDFVRPRKRENGVANPSVSGSNLLNSGKTKIGATMAPMMKSRMATPVPNAHHKRGARRKTK